MADKATLNYLPVEIVTEILYLLDNRSLCAVGQTSSQYASLAFDDVLWSRRLHNDFNFPTRVPATSIGWRKFYSRMTHAKVYLWGANASNGRLAIPIEDLFSKYHITRGPERKGFEQPIELKRTRQQNEEVGRIVQIIAGGWNCHAITSAGKVLAWGQMDGEAHDGPGTVELEPICIHFDYDPPVVSLSTGRKHVLALDSDGGIREWCTWDEISYITEPSLEEQGVLQLEAGWHFSSALSKTGRVYVWWLDKSIETQPVERRNIIDGNAQVSLSWNISAVELPFDKPFTQIGAGDNFIVALTEFGEIHRFNLQSTGHGNGNIKQQISAAILTGDRYWEYLPQFSEMDKIRKHAVYADRTIKPPLDSSKITYIDAHFQTFAAYTQGTNSLVLLGTAQSQHPDIKASLQNRGIVKITQGDWHHGAVTDTGELLVWGNDDGALGLKVDKESPRVKVTEPQPVYFGQNTFVFSADFAGWHSSAMVLDMSDTPDLEPPENIPKSVLGRAWSAATSLFGSGRPGILLALLVIWLAVSSI